MVDATGKMINDLIRKDKTAPSNPNNQVTEAENFILYGSDSSDTQPNETSPNTNSDDVASTEKYILTGESPDQPKLDLNLNPYMDAKTKNLYKLKAVQDANLEEAVNYINQGESKYLGDLNENLGGLAAGFIDNTVNLPAALSGLATAVAPYTPVGVAANAADKLFGTKLGELQKAPNQWVQNTLEQGTAKLLGFNDYGDYRKSVDDLASKSVLGYLGGSILPDVISSGGDILRGVSKLPELVKSGKKGMGTSVEDLTKILQEAGLQEKPMKPSNEFDKALPDMSQAYQDVVDNITETKPVVTTDSQGNITIDAGLKTTEKPPWMMTKDEYDKYYAETFPDSKKIKVYETKTFPADATEAEIAQYRIDIANKYRYDNRNSNSPFERAFKSNMEKKGISKDKYATDEEWYQAVADYYAKKHGVSIKVKELNTLDDVLKANLTFPSVLGSVQKYGQKSFTLIINNLIKSNKVEVLRHELEHIIDASKHSSAWENKRGHFTNYKNEGEFLSQYTHKKAVETAIENGDTIPDNVLKDYPELKANLDINDLRLSKLGSDAKQGGEFIQDSSTFWKDAPDLNVPENGGVDKSKTILDLDKYGINRDYNVLSDKDLNEAADNIINNYPDFAEEFMKSQDVPNFAQALRRRVSLNMAKKQIDQEKEMVGILDDLSRQGRDVARTLRLQADPALKAPLVAQGVIRKATPEKFQGVIDDAVNIDDDLTKIKNESLNEVFGLPELKGDLPELKGDLPNLDSGVKDRLQKTVDTMVNEANTGKNISITEAITQEATKKVEGMLKSPNTEIPYTSTLANRIGRTIIALAKEKGVIKEAGNKDSILKVIGQGLENTEKYKSIYAEVQKRIKDSEDLTDTEKAKAAKFLEDLMDKPYSSQQTQQALKEVIAQAYSKEERRTLIEDLAKGWVRNKELNTQKLSKKMQDMLGIDPTLAKQFEDDFFAAYNMAIKIKQQKLLEQKLTPIVRDQKTKKDLIDRILELHNLGAFNSQTMREAFAAKFNLPVMNEETAKTLKQLSELYQTLPVMDTKREEVRGLIGKVIVNLLPTGTGEKLKALQDINFLSGLKTHLVNISGNAVLGQLKGATDVVGATVLDPIGGLFGIPKDFTLPSQIEGLKGLVKGSKLGFRDARLGIDTGPINSLESIRNKTIFGRDNTLISKTLGKHVLEPLRRVVYGSLQTFDRAFFESRYAVVAKQLKDLGRYSPSEIDEIASKEALQATFQNNIKLGTPEKNVDATKAMMDLRNALNFGQNYGIGTGLMAYLKTPINLGASVYNYSPLGLTRLLVDPDRSTRNLKNIIGESIVGSGLVGAGFGLGSLYNPTKQSDKYQDRSKLQALNYKQGIQPSSVNINGSNVGLGMVQPVASALDLGSVYRRELENGKNPVDAYLSGLYSQGEGLLGLPVLQTARSLVDFTRSPESAERGIGNIPIEAGRRLVPSLIKQIERSTSKTYNETYNENPWVQARNEVLSGIPGLSSKLPSKLDIYGDPALRAGGDPLLGILNNVSPITIENIKEDKRLENIKKLYRSTGDSSTLPEDFKSNKLKVDNKMVGLTIDQAQQRKKYAGERFNQYLTELMNDPEFNSASKETQAIMIDKLNAIIEKAANLSISRGKDADMLIKEEIRKQFRRDYKPFSDKDLTEIIKNKIPLGDLGFSKYYNVEDKALSGLK